MSADTLTVPQFAERVGIATSSAYDWIRSDDFPLPVVRVGRTMRLPTVQVEFFLLHGRAPASTAELLEHAQGRAS